MTELIKISDQDNKQVLSARDLHEFLELKIDFIDWWNNVCFNCKLIENRDYKEVNIKNENNLNNNESTFTDYVITLEKIELVLIFFTKTSSNRKYIEVIRYLREETKKYESANRYNHITKNKMSELIKTSNHDNILIVSARDLHKFLEEKIEFIGWWEKVEFGNVLANLEKNEDYFINYDENENIDYNLTINTAAKISRYFAIQYRDEKSKEAFYYFVKYNSMLIEIRDKPIIDKISNALKFTRIHHTVKTQKSGTVGYVELGTLLEIVDLYFEEKENILYIWDDDKLIEANIKNVEYVIECNIHEVGRSNNNYYDGTEEWY